MKCAAILFDLDETLTVEHASVDAAFEAACGPAARRCGVGAAAVSEALRRRGRELWHQSPTLDWCRQIGISSWEAMSGDLGGGCEGMARLRSWVDESEFRARSWRAAMAEFGVEAEALARRSAERLVEVRRGVHALFPETLGALEAVGRGRRLGILTNGPPRVQRGKLAATGLEKYFDAIVISGEVGVGKPDARVFEIALARLGAAARATVMVGDSLRRDIAGARNAGLRSVWVNRYGKDRTDGPAPDAEAADLTDLLMLLDAS